MDRIGAHIHHVSARLEVSVVARDVQWCELVRVLLVQRLLDQGPNPDLEVLLYVAELTRLQQMLELLDQEAALPGVKGRPSICAIKRPYLKVILQEALIVGLRADIDLEQTLDAPIRLGELRHGRVMKGPPSILVLLDQDLPVSLNDGVGIPLEKSISSHIKVSMPSDCICIVIARAHQMPMLYVQVLEIVTFLEFV